MINTFSISFSFLLIFNDSYLPNKQTGFGAFDGSFLLFLHLLALLSCYSIELLFSFYSSLFIIYFSIYLLARKLTPFLLRLGFSLTLKECTGLIHFVAILSAYLPFFPFLLSRAYL